MAAAARKRPCVEVQEVPEPASIELMPLAVLQASSLTPLSPRNDWVYNSDVPSDRLALIQKLWTGNFSDCVGALAAENPALHAQLHAIVANTYTPSDAQRYDREQELRLDAVLRNLVRAKSQKRVPLFTAAHSITAVCYQLPGPLWAVFYLPAPDNPITGIPTLPMPFGRGAVVECEPPFVSASRGTNTAPIMLSSVVGRVVAILFGSEWNDAKGKYETRRFVLVRATQLGVQVSYVIGMLQVCCLFVSYGLTLSLSLCVAHCTSYVVCM